MDRKGGANKGPEGVRIDAGSGIITASPETAGNYTAWLVAEIAARPAKGEGVAVELDQVLIKKWELQVTELYIFDVKTFARRQVVHTVTAATNLAMTTKLNCSLQNECIIGRVDEGSIVPVVPQGSVSYTARIGETVAFECPGIRSGSCVCTSLIEMMIGPPSGHITFFTKGLYADKLEDTSGFDVRTGQTGKAGKTGKTGGKSGKTRRGHALHPTRNITLLTCRATLSAVWTMPEVAMQSVDLQTFDITFRNDDTEDTANGPGSKGVD